MNLDVGFDDSYPGFQQDFEFAPKTVKQQLEEKERFSEKIPSERSRLKW